MLLHANQAAKELLDAWDCSPGERVLASWADREAEASAEGTARIRDAACEEKAFSFTIAPILDVLRDLR